VVARRGIPALLLAIAACSCRAEQQPPPHVPGPTWERRAPADLGLDVERLEHLSVRLGGRCCVVKNGYVVAAWGDQARRSDILSSAKPVFSTLLFFAVAEGRVRSVDQPIVEFGWPLRPEDRGITFRHLGAMTSGYARPEGPGEAWAYNDYAIQLYQLTLFDRVYGGDAKEVLEDPRRLGALQLEDGLKLSERRRIRASTRDFARIAWLWANLGRWGETQLLPRDAFQQHLAPQAPQALPVSRPAATDDYLHIGTFGGESEHFTRDGPGIYGFNWWFNRPDAGRDGRLTWPDAPSDTFMAIGAVGNNAAMIPSLGLALVCLESDWDDLRPGETTSKINQALGELAAAAGPAPAAAPGTD